jgi:hypothetical protein
MTATQATPDGIACIDCGHGKRAHAHFRPGTDCSLCECPRWPGLIRRALATIRRQA